MKPEQRLLIYKELKKGVQERLDEYRLTNTASSVGLCFELYLLYKTGFLKERRMTEIGPQYPELWENTDNLYSSTYYWTTSVPKCWIRRLEVLDNAIKKLENDTKAKD